jgi:hypothetical protein
VKYAYHVFADQNERHARKENRRGGLANYLRLRMSNQRRMEPDTRCPICLARKGIDSTYSLSGGGDMDVLTVHGHGGVVVSR